MLLLKNRLRKKQEFENVLKNGKSFFYENISLRMVKNNQENSRIGFIISNKFSKKATERNKIKRQLRAIFYKTIPILKKGKDIVIIPLKKEKSTPDSFRENIEKALKKAKLIN